MNNQTLLTSLLLSILITLAAVTTDAIAQENGEVCQAFSEGQVAPEILDSMMAAADSGHLYRIETASSKMEFCVSRFPFTEVRGNFSEFRGGMALASTPPSNRDNQILVAIDAQSLDTQDDVINRLVKGEDFFDTKNHPEIIFISNGFEWTGKDTARLRGDLTLRGITRPVVFDVELEPPQKEAGTGTSVIRLNGETEISRSEFGMTRLAGIVSDKVRICLRIEAVLYRDAMLRVKNGQHAQDTGG
jgi:polyisoprenoid-binding protein YceI